MRLSFLNNHRKSIADEVVERIIDVSRDIVGPVLRISSSIRMILDRLIGLYFLDTSSTWERTHLSTAILTDLDMIKYPPYSIIRSKPVFASRKHWEEYEEALSYEKTIMDVVENRNGNMMTLDLIRDLVATARGKWQTCCQEPPNDSYFLRRYSHGWVYTRVLFTLVTLLEKARDFGQANSLLEMLLSQEHYCLGHRGRWWERLVINVTKHLRDKSSAMGLIKRALVDPHIGTGSRLALQRRLGRLSQTACELEEPPLTITIYADPENTRVTGKKLLYLLPGEALGSVEDLALAHFESEGWRGFHSESRIYRTLFGLLFWEIIFDDIPNVFQTPHQTAPLDLRTDAFYVARYEKIEHRLQSIIEGQAPHIIVDIYYPFYGCQAIGVLWEEYSLDSLLDICHALGGDVLAPIMRLLAEDYLRNCEGLPDLLLYNSDRRDYLLVEVKSAKDRLSDGQKNWNAFFRQHDIKFVLCRVLNTSQRNRSIGQGRK